MRRGANKDWQVTMALGIPIGNRQAIASFTDSEYALTQAGKGLETLEHAADQTRRVRVADRAASSSGSTTSVIALYGSRSRNQDVSLVVSASTTDRCAAGSGRRCRMPR